MLRMSSNPGGWSCNISFACCLLACPSGDESASQSHTEPKLLPALDAQAQANRARKSTPTAATERPLRRGHGAGVSWAETQRDAELSGLGPAEPRPPPGKINRGDLTVGGALEPRTVHRVLLAHQNELRACSADAEVFGDRAKDITIDFTIVGNGRVSSTRVTAAATETDATTDCVVNAMKDWVFPSVSDGGETNVSYRLRRPPS
ncbi:MAG: AgmX/PglI C-terminal domain-containing protein [Myxococcales bacterium FL481]|nr:MAG: AgmX/PglI C-terminal domain-containing protein [Myxococcales bacterium FL481]